MAYNLGDLQTELQVKAKDSTIPQNLLTYFLNDAQRNILGSSTYSFMEEQPANQTLTVGQTNISFETDHQVTISIDLIDPNVSTRVTNLIYDPADHFYELYPNPAAVPQAMPEAYTIFGNLMYFNCPLDQAYLYRHRYVRKPTEMVNSTDVPDIPSEWRHVLINYAMGAIEEWRDNFAFASMYISKGDIGVEDMGVRLAIRQYGTPNVIQNALGDGYAVFTE